MGTLIPMESKLGTAYNRELRLLFRQSCDIIIKIALRDGVRI